MSRRLSEFLDPANLLAIQAERLGTTAELDPLIKGLSYDSRKVEPGFMFFALRGFHTDGHAYIEAALQAGAVVVVHEDELPSYRDNVVYLKAEDSRAAMSMLAAAFFGSPSNALAVIGVTGTEGKSTTVFLIYQLLEMAGHRTGFISTVQYKTADDEVWNPEHQTTPEATTVQAALAAMRDNVKEFAVLEASSHGLSERTGRLANVAFDVGVMTSVTQEHLEFHGSWEQYQADKARLFRLLDANSHEKALPAGLSQVREVRRVPAFGVVNADDPSAEYFRSVTSRRIYTFSVEGAEADVSVRALAADSDGNHYEVYIRAVDETLRFRDYLPGAFNAGNVLAALLVVSGLLNRPVAAFLPFVPRLRSVRGRMTAIRAGQNFELIVDYAHTPSSFMKVLPPLKQRLAESGGRLICLFGSGGERDRIKRPEQGRIAAEWSDIVILADEDPRGENPLELLEEIAAGCVGKTRGESLFLIPDRPQAIRKALSLARRGDAVILLGKGHENSIIYDDKIIPYDEITEAKHALADLGWGD